MINEPDPDVTAKEARRFPETEKILRQFLSLESCNAATPAYRKAYDRIKAEKHPFKEPKKCGECAYVAECLEDVEWHEEQCGHDGDGFTEVVCKFKINCTHCGGPHVDRGEWAKKPHRTHLCESCGQEFEHAWRGVGV